MVMKKFVAVFAFLVLSLFLLGACALGQGGRSGMQAVAVGKEAPDFTLNDLNGNEVNLKSLRGSPILLVFGATWCPYCVKEIPDLNKLQADYGKRGLVILDVDINESQAKVASFVKEKGITYKVLLDAGGNIAERYGVIGIPTNVLIDKEGIIRYKNNPIPERAEIEKLL